MSSSSEGKFSAIPRIFPKEKVARTVEEHYAPIDNSEGLRDIIRIHMPEIDEDSCFFLSLALILNHEAAIADVCGLWSAQHVQNKIKRIEDLISEIRNLFDDLPSAVINNWFVLLPKHGEQRKEELHTVIDDIWESMGHAGLHPSDCEEGRAAINSGRRQGGAIKPRVNAFRLLLIDRFWSRYGSGKIKKRIFEGRANDNHARLEGGYETFVHEIFKELGEFDAENGEPPVKRVEKLLRQKRDFGKEIREFAETYGTG